MKNLFIAFAFLCLLSCADNLDEPQQIQEKSSSNSVILFEDFNELPDISILSPYVSSIQIDDTRMPTIDKANSILKIPVSVELLVNSNINYFMWKGIKIARYKEKPGCLHCVDCIGFRCKPNKPTLVSISSLSEFNNVLDFKFRDTQLSVDREQDFIVKIDYNEQVLEFHSNKLIDWEKLM